MSKDKTAEVKESKELIVQDKVELVKLFEVKNGMQPVLDRLKEVATDFSPDTTTDKGRKLIASQAHAVSKSKTFLDGMGKDLTQEWRDKTSVVNTSRNSIKSFCDELRDEIRKPLTEYEEAEKEKVAKLKSRLADITNIIAASHKMTDLSILKKRYEEVSNMDIENGGWGELEFNAFKAKDQVSRHLKNTIEEREKYDKDQKELEDLRKKEEQRKKDDAAREIKEEAQRKKDAEIQRKKDQAIADKKAGEDKKIADKKAEDDEANRVEREKLEAKTKEQQDKIDKVEKEKQDAKAKEIKEREEKEKAQREKEQAQKDKDLADQRAKDAETKLKKIEDDKRAEEEKEKLRKENEAKNEKENKKAVHNLMLDALIKNGFSDDDGKKIVTLIAKGLIPNIKVDYNRISN